MSAKRLLIDLDMPLLFRAACPVVSECSVFLHEVLCIRRPEKISNGDLWKVADQEPLAAWIRRRKWIWTGYILRKPASNITRQALIWTPQGKRKRGRPRVGLATPSGSLPTTLLFRLWPGIHRVRGRGEPRNTWGRDSSSGSLPATSPARLWPGLHRGRQRGEDPGPHGAETPRQKCWEAVMLEGAGEDSPESGACLFVCWLLNVPATC